MLDLDEELLGLKGMLKKGWDAQSKEGFEDKEKL